MRGGPRPNAGRPRAAVPMVNLQGRVPPDLAEWVASKGGLRAVLMAARNLPDVSGLMIALQAASESAERLAGSLPYDPESLSQAFMAGRAEGFARAATLAKEILEA